MARLLGDGWDPGPGTEPPTHAAGPRSSSEPPTAEGVWAALEGVPDPEVPVISVVELGIVRDVAVADGAVTVTITPTYSGCPAMQEIERDVLAALRGRGWTASVRTTFTPAWTTDWMTEVAREKLRAYGIAPPGPTTAGQTLVQLRRRGEAPAPDVEAGPTCPRCGSPDTRLESRFGSTACKAMHTCRACGEPFEEFKPV
jgi:ring-1,2-phenylacetyl-CoA epoxidase subunit PaaD